MLTLSLDCLSSSCILCTQCWHCLSIVCFHPVSCVPNVDSVSRMFIFILYLVYPMLTLSLHCMFPSCILCTQCWQCLSIVCLHPVSCVPNVDSVSRLFIFILYLVCPMLTLSLECLSSSCILCAQCWHCLSSVYLHPVSCVPNVDIVSRLFVFILYLVCLMLTVSLECLSSSCILCTQCWHCLSIVYLQRHFIFILYIVCPMLTLSLECLSSSCILCAQCWHCLSIVYLHPVSWVPNVDSVSRLFIFILYLVCPMLTLSLDVYLQRQCQHWAHKIQDEDKHSRDNVNIGHTIYRMKINNRSCILCTQCWQCLSIIYLHPVSCVPNVDIVSRLFIFILYLVYPMLTVSLDCLSSSCILCTQCWQCLSIVYLHPVSCVPNVDIVSRVFIFILYLVCPMLTLSLDCLSSETLYLHPVSCVPNVDIVSRLFIFILYLVCLMLTVSLECLSSSCILCPNVDSVSRLFIFILYLVVPNVDSVSRLFIFILYLVYPMLTVSLDCLSSSCILCAQCWHCLSIVYLQRHFIFILYLVYPMLTVSFDCLSSETLYRHPVSCVPNVDIVSRLFIFILYLVYPMLTLSLDCLFSSCILCAYCWQCLSNVYLHPVSCVPNVDIVSPLYVSILYLVYPMLTVSLHCLSSSCILCTQCWQCLSIIYLHPVSCVPNVDIVSRVFIFILYLCVPNVDIVSRVFIFILYLVCPMLTVSLDCLSSSCILCAQC